MSLQSDDDRDRNALGCLVITMGVVAFTLSAIVHLAIWLWGHR